MSVVGLFFTFCKFSLLCFGGGYMLIPLLTAEFVGAGKLLTPEQFGNLVSIAQLTPGPVGINTATFAGFLESGFAGALAATLGLVFPTLILATLAVSLIRVGQDQPAVRAVLYGARLGAAALVVFAVVIFCGMSVFSGRVFSPGGMLIAVLAFILTLKRRGGAAAVILLSGLLGAVLIPWIG